MLPRISTHILMLALTCAAVDSAATNRYTNTSTPRPTYPPTTAQTPPTPWHMAQQKVLTNKRKQPGNPKIYHFQDAEGRVLFTNRPQRYKRNPNYSEVKIDYDPIIFPTWFQGNKEIDDYSIRDIGDLARRYANIYRVDKALILAIIEIESGFNPRALSKAGARGLMQLMPGTAAEMGVTNIFDPAQNIAGGTQYLSKLLALHNGDERMALAAYNAGPGAVKAHGGVPPYKETKRYITNVLHRANENRRTGTTARDRLAALNIDTTQKKSPTSPRHATPSASTAASYNPPPTYTKNAPTSTSYTEAEPTPSKKTSSARS